MKIISFRWLGVLFARSVPASFADPGNFCSNFIVFMKFIRHIVVICLGMVRAGWCLFSNNGGVK